MGGRFVAMVTSVIVVAGTVFAGGVSASAAVPSTIVVNQEGYLLAGPKQATLISDTTGTVSWQLLDASQAVVASGSASSSSYVDTADANARVIDFATLPSPTGQGFTLKADGATSLPFSIGVSRYEELRTESLEYFYYARSGLEIFNTPGHVGYERAAGHLGVAPNKGDVSVPCQPLNEAVYDWTCDYSRDVQGGWYDAGDQGKYVVNGGIAVAQLLSTWERNITATSAIDGAFDDGQLGIPNKTNGYTQAEKANGVPDILDEARWELEFLLRMQVPAGKPLAGMAFHKVQDEKWTGPPLYPSDDPEERELHRPSTAATLNLAAAAAQGYRVFNALPDSSSKTFAAKLLAASKTAWAAAKANPAIYATAADGEDGGGAYSDDNVQDEFYWAGTELYISTGDVQYKSSYPGAGTFKPWDFSSGGFSWRRTGLLGALDMASVAGLQSDADKAAAKSALVTYADQILSRQNAEPFGQTYTPPDGQYTWGSNSAILNNQVILGTAFDVTNSAKYKDAVLEAMDYLLGRNAIGQSYITGYGTKYSINQHSLWFAHSRGKGPRPPDGSIAGGPNSYLEDQYIRDNTPAGCPSAAQKCYVDNERSYSTNEIAINWNSALTWVASFVADQAANEVAPGKITGGTPKITGTAEVGSTLTATPGTWSPSDVTLSYQWYAGTTVIPESAGGTSPSFLIRSADVDKTVTVRVTGTKPGYASVTTTSAPTAKVVKPVIVAGNVTIAGSPVIGSTLTANTGTWTPAGVTFTYKWYANGVEISGATAATYVVKSGDKGKTIYVKVYGAKTGLTTVTKKSAATSAVTSAPTSSISGPTPVISGTVAVGQKLTANAGSWTPSGVTLSYRWYADGVAQSTASTSTMYTVKSTDVGKKLTVRVTGSKSGLTTVTKESAQTITVPGSSPTPSPSPTPTASPTPTPSPSPSPGAKIVGTTPTISGSIDVGSALTALPGTWSPAGVSLTYQWSNEKGQIAGATQATYVLQGADRGLKVQVAVTGSIQGQASVTLKSEKTRKVK